MSTPAPAENLFPADGAFLGRADKERLTGQQARVVWLTGLSGSGKTTLANALERRLHADGFLTTLLDGDTLRQGLCTGLGFSDDERAENIRRAAEASKLLLQAGVVCVNAFITPKNSLRAIAREVLGADLIEVYVECSFEECARRDVKGLYAKARSGGVANFTGQGSAFEPPSAPDLTIRTEQEPLEASLERLYAFVRPQLGR
jgi:adenylylsulfate kinase